MTLPPQIFDRALLKQRRKKAAPSIEKFDFLLQIVSEDIVDRVTVVMREFPLVLNLGSHHGVLSRQLSDLPNVTQIISLDSVYEMVSSAPALQVIANEDALPFAPMSFDMVVSPLSLQWINDLPGTLLQIRQSLKPDGAFVAAILGGETLAELRHVFLLAEEELYGGASPRVAPFADVRDMGNLLQRAGFTLPVTDRDVLKVRYPSALHLMKELQAMGASNVLMNRSRTHNSKALFQRVNELYKEHYSDDDGRIFASFEIIHLMGWAPHPDQQQPLRPGSAMVNLKDVF